MAKTNKIKKFINGEIADGDDVNQVVENAGSEGGLIPYDASTNEKSSDGSQSLGNTQYPWGSLKINQDAELVEVNAATHSDVSSVAIKNLRKFIYLKDAPDSYSGQANKFVRVKTDESGLEFAAPVSSEIFLSSGSITIPDGITEVYLSMCGGGGGGSSRESASIGGGGGGGGQACVNYRVPVTPGATYTITIGAGGGANSDGGNTSFGSIVCLGGNKGLLSVGGAAHSLDGGTGAGNQGKFGVQSGAGGNGSSSSQCGCGGGTPFGIGGNIYTGVGTGNAANNSGGGGGGSPASSTGGSGGSGICIVMY